MSSRHDYKRGDRSWERGERNRDRGGHRGGRRSRSRSPPRRSERDRRGGPGASPLTPICLLSIGFNVCGTFTADRRGNYARDREDDRRDTRPRDDRRDDRRRDDRDRRDHDRDRDGKREPPPPPPPRDANRDRHDKDKDVRQVDRTSEHEAKPTDTRDRQHTGADLHPRSAQTVEG